MELSKIYKNSQANKIISSDLTADMLNHCYLLSSVDDVLRPELAKYMAKQILCTGSDAPCDKCVNCEKISHSNMVDLKIYPDGDRSLMVEDITNIVTDAFVRPIESKYKIFILNDFDECTVQGQNKILKTLEEPPRNVIFILTCSNLNNVLTTILSRAKKITESSMDIEVVEEYLKGLNVSNASLIASISNGNISSAMKLIKNSNVNEIISLVFDILFNLKGSSDVLKFSSKILALKKDIAFFMEIFISIIRDILCYKNNCDLSFKNYTNNYEILSKIYTSDMIEKIMKNICLIANKMEFNCNLTGVIDKFLLDVLEVKFLCQR
jgi:DNA polymerase-3 subunit delta'